QSVCASSCGHFWARIGFSVGANFVVVDVDVRASPMVVVLEALGRPVADLTKDCFPSPIGFV
ncbi:hypothetical protein A2U01_0103478, partial [Trifolium medium]|nr:hypothetical protein [Trifolium medium]